MAAKDTYNALNAKTFLSSRRCLRNILRYPSFHQGVCKASPKHGEAARALGQSRDATCGGTWPSSSRSNSSRRQPRVTLPAYPGKRLGRCAGWRLFHPRSGPALDRTSPEGSSTKFVSCAFSQQVALVLTRARHTCTIGGVGPE